MEEGRDEEVTQMDQLYELTAAERNLVNNNIDFYTSLSSGKRKPKTEAQRHFLLVCKGKAKANTMHELAFIKYRMELIAFQKEEKKRKEHGVREFEPDHPDGTWFTNNDWEKLHSNKSHY
jgi:uncharacterized protein YifE (UPF0438 family)